MRRLAENLQGFFRRTPAALSMGNGFRNKAGAFPHSGAGCDMQDKVRDLKMKKYGSLPAFGLPVLVQCDGFRCMAYRDREGRWVDLFSCEFMPRVLGVVAG